MTTKLTPKQRAFADNIVAGMTKRDAAVHAGYPANSATQAATRLGKHPGIRAAIKAAKVTTQTSPVITRSDYPDAMSFLMDAMNNPSLSIGSRMDAAKALLPFQHAKIGEQGKKAAAKERAAEVTKSRAPMAAPPRLSVVRTE